jgi:hypothetical protein
VGYLKAKSLPSVSVCGEQHACAYHDPLIAYDPATLHACLVSTIIWGAAAGCHTCAQAIAGLGLGAAYGAGAYMITVGW